MRKYKAIPLLPINGGKSALLYGDLHVTGDLYTGDTKAAVIPSVTVELGLINGIMNSLVAKVLDAGDNLVCTSIDTSADNTLHSVLDGCRNTYGNTLTVVTAGTTARTMTFKYDNRNANGGIYSCNGFYVDEAMSVFITFTLVVEWNRISVFATLYTYYD